MWYIFVLLFSVSGSRQGHARHVGRRYVNGEWNLEFVPDRRESEFHGSSASEGNPQTLETTQSNPIPQNTPVKVHSQLSQKHRSEQNTLKNHAVRPGAIKDVGKTGPLTYGRSFHYIFPVCLFVVVVFELVHLSISDVDWSRPYETPQARMASQSNPFEFNVWMRLAYPYFQGAGRHKGIAYILVKILLLGGGLYISFSVNNFVNVYWDMVEQKRMDVFIPLMFTFGAVLGTSIILGVYNSYITQMLVIHWRQDMTKRFQSAWLRNQVFYKIDLASRGVLDEWNDNPDQRIQEDVLIFITNLLALGDGFVMSLGHLVIFAPLLYTQSPPGVFGSSIVFPGWLLYLSFVYSFAATMITHYIGRSLIMYEWGGQQFDANYRASLMRVRNNAETIAIQQTEDQQHDELDRHFDNVKRNFWERMFIAKRLDIFTSFYDRSMWILPLMCLFPSYFSGHISLGIMMQVRHCMEHVVESFNWFLNSYTLFIEWRASINRLDTFEKTIQTAEGLKSIRNFNECGDLVSVANLSVKLPNGDTLISNLSLAVTPGRWLLISGPEGSGKTTLLRSLAGIWPYVDVRGKCTMPPRDQCLFIPSTGLSRKGSIRQAMRYPGNHRWSDGALRDALSTVGLSRFSVDLDGTEIVSSMSSGEKQRMELAYAVLAQPRWLFLDEATCHVEASGHSQLYNAIREQMPHTTVISVAHNVSELQSHHNVCLHMDPIKKQLSDVSICDTGSETQPEKEPVIAD